MPFTPSFLKRAAYITLLSFVFTSCAEGIFESGLDEGVIEYRIDYPALQDDHIMMDLLPKKMETSFKEGNYRSEIIAGMGIFKTAIIHQSDKEKLTHTIKLLNKKLASDLDQTDVSKLNHQFDQLEFKPTNGKKIIAGYECKEAVVTVTEDSTWEFKIYYTDEIDIDRPNYMSPYDEIEGVLMQYEMVSHDLHMRFTAENVFKKEISLEEIQLSEDYVMVSPQELSSELDAIFEKVK